MHNLLWKIYLVWGFLLTRKSYFPSRKIVGVSPKEKMCPIILNMVLVLGKNTITKYFFLATLDLVVFIFGNIAFSKIWLETYWEWLGS